MGKNGVVIALAMALMVATWLCHPTAVAQMQPTLQRDALEAHVNFLASDLLEGREAGQRGHEIAAAYVANQLKSYGVSGGVDGESYLQAVPMIETRRAGSASASLEFQFGDSRAFTPSASDHFVFASTRGPKTALRAPVVFAGFGLASSTYGRDDFRDLDLRGKIALVLQGAPAFLNSEERSHYAATVTERLAARDAVGAIFLSTPESENAIPFQTMLGYLRQQTFMSWLDDKGNPHTRSPGIQAMAMLSTVGASQLFQEAGVSWSDILVSAQSADGAVAGFDFPGSVSIEVESQLRRLSSPNVVGIIEGSDPHLSEQYVVLCAHLDHLGLSRNGVEDADNVFNGAMDNAAGIAVLLESAKRLALSPPKRSVVILAVTAEEKGLVGSSYFASNPTVPAEAIVAVVNLDSPIMTYNFTDVVAFGAARSTLFPVVQAAVSRAGLMLSPDPVPEQSLFTRSDQYSFVRRGVPAVSLKPGFANGGQEAQQLFRSSHYHKVSDEPRHIDYRALQRFAEVKLEIARGIADMSQRPLWRRGDFFATVFAGPMEE